MTTDFENAARFMIQNMRTTANNHNMAVHDNENVPFNTDMRDFLHLVALEAERILGSGITSAQPERWRVGSHYGIHVYQGETPVCTALTVEFARRIVQDHNAGLVASTQTEEVAP